MYKSSQNRVQILALFLRQILDPARTQIWPKYSADKSDKSADKSDNILTHYSEFWKYSDKNFFRLEIFCQKVEKFFDQNFFLRLKIFSVEDFCKFDIFWLELFVYYY